MLHHERFRHASLVPQPHSHQRSRSRRCHWPRAVQHNTQDWLLQPSRTPLHANFVSVSQAPDHTTDALGMAVQKEEGAPSFHNVDKIWSAEGRSTCHRMDWRMYLFGMNGQGTSQPGLLARALYVSMPSNSAEFWVLLHLLVWRRFTRKLSSLPLAVGLSVQESAPVAQKAVNPRY